MKTRLTLVRGLVAAVAAITAWGSPAQAQCTQMGNFIAFSGPWQASNSTQGIQFPNGTTMIVDTNGDGLTGPEDTTYAVPAAIQPTRFITRLSPTREFLVVVGGAQFGLCDANRTVRVYQLSPMTATMSLVHEDCLPCVVFNGPFFYDLGAVPPAPFPPPVTGQRVLMFHTGAGAPCSPSNEAMPLLRWYDLNTPGGSGIADTDLGLWPGISMTTLRVSPSGFQAFVQHDQTNTPASSDYDIINLCPGPDFGTIVPNEMGPPINDRTGFPLPVGFISAVTATQVTVQMRVNSTVIWQAVLPNCCAGAPTGACCLNGGGCVVTTQAQCSGTWTEGVTCAQAACPPPPIPQLAITMTGPAQVPQRGFVDYTLTYQNNGGAAAQNVQVLDRIPTGLNFVSASNGGVFQGTSSNQVLWTLGTLPAQSGPQTLTLRAQAGCTFTQYTNQFYSISATGYNVNGSPPVTTLIIPGSTGGSVSGTVTSVTGATQPLLPESVIRHTWTLTNTSAVPLTDIKFNSYAGYAQRFTTFVDQGTGVLSFPFGAGTYMEWVGNLTPGQTTTIIIDAAINSCISSGEDTTQLNMGNNITVSTACGSLLGTIPISPAFTIQQPVSATLVAIEQANLIGPLVPGTPTYPSPMQFVKETPTIDLVLNVANHTGAPITGASLSLELPPAWITANPPFTGSPAGFAYDPGTDIVTYMGDIPAAGLPPVTIRTRPNVEIEGSVELSVMRTIPSPLPSCSVFIGSLDLVNMPDLPTEPVVLGVEKWFTPGLWTCRPGIDPLPVEYFSRCEIWRGLHVEPNGDIWLAGAPVFMFNPATLATESAPGLAAFMETLGLDESDCTDLAVDPVDGSLVIIAAGRTVQGTYYPPALIRYDRTTSTPSIITRDPVLELTDNRADVLVDPTGTIYVANREVLARIPRAMAVPIPDGQVPLLSVPHPTYSFAPTAGTLTTQKVHAAGWSCDGQMLLMHASLFVGGTNPEALTVDTTVYALSTYDPATNTIVVGESQLAANAGDQGNRAWPVEFTPQLPLNAVLEDSCMDGGEAGRVIVANHYYPYHCIYDSSLVGGGTTAIVPAESWHLRAAADIAYLNGGCDSGPTCDGDVNCDFALDGFDVEVQEKAVGGDMTDYCQSNPDFNGDFALDGFDVEAVEVVVGGGACP